MPAAEIVAETDAPPEDIAHAIWSWMRSNVRYAREPGEVLELPGFTLRHRVADCDGHCMLFLALAGALDVDAACRVGWAPRLGDGAMAPMHVWPVVRGAGGRLWHACTTTGAPFGVDPMSVIRSV